MRIGELFAGYGGLGMGVKAAIGGEVAWVSDIDPGANRILEHRFPGVPNLGDISAVDWSQVEPVDVLTGGFPCQDVSAAGKRAGIRPGTRSGLWSMFAYAISQLRPSLVVIENVRGLLSAQAHSDVEPCPWCLGDGSDGALRALGAVLGDLASLGYDASWHGLRAADVGAPHGRWRVFITAYPRGGSLPWTSATGNGLPVAPERGVRTLLPTPTSRDWKDGGPVDAVPTNGLLGRTVWPDRLLPTPAVNDMGEGKTPDAWDEWTAKMQSAHGNGNGRGKSLAIEAQRLLPTPSVALADGGQTSRSGNRKDELLLAGIAEEIARASATEGGPGEVLRDLRGSDGTQEVQRALGGQDPIPGATELLAGVRQHESGGDEGRAALAGAAPQGSDLSGVRDKRAPARTSPRPQSGEQRADELGDALRELSPQVALAGGPGEATSDEPVVDWGPYEAAIRRWEYVLGRPAPAPTELGPKGSPRLSPIFVEFLMGLPAGHVTDVPGLTRNAQLKALGNGVVPQQCEAALRLLLPTMEEGRRMPRDGMSLRLDDANILTNIPDTTPEQTAAAARMARDWATRRDVDTAGLADVLDALGVA